jgi:hypothetical protein
MNQGKASAQNNALKYGHFEAISRTRAKVLKRARTYIIILPLDTLVFNM